MQDLTFPIGEDDNYGSVRQFWFVPVEDVESVVENVVTVKDGKRWFEGGGIKYTLVFDEGKKETRSGAAYDPELKGEIARWSQELQDALDLMDGRHFLVVFKDRNGFNRLVGDTEQYLKFEYTTTTGQNVPDRNGVKFSFKGSRFSIPSQIFDEELSPAPAPPPEPSGDPVTVQVNGLTVGFAQPGGTVNITSEYTFEYEILAP